jgi:hypothetical protein
MFKNPTEENAYYYQESYKHLSSSVEWGTLSMEEKQKQLEEDIKLMKDKKLFDTYKEQEKQKEKEEEKEKEKERLRMSPPSYLKDDPSISPPFVVDTPTDLPPDIDLIPSQEISEMRERLDQRDEDEELTEENLEGGGITILNNIAKDETDPTKNLKQVKYDAKD